MNRAEADWRLLIHGGARHGFTHRTARPGANGVAYHRAADESAFAATSAFLAG